MFMQQKMAHFPLETKIARGGGTEYAGTVDIDDKSPHNPPAFKADGFDKVMQSQHMAIEWTRNIAHVIRREEFRGETAPPSEAQMCSTFLRAVYGAGYDETFDGSEEEEEEEEEDEEEEDIIAKYALAALEEEEEDHALHRGVRFVEQCEEASE